MNEPTTDTSTDSEARRATARGWAEKRRATLSREGVCINGRSHGKATDGCRCRWCYAVHKYGLEVVLVTTAAPASWPYEEWPPISPRRSAVLPEFSDADVSETG